ncbi:nucleotidyltransferase domain-containing protein [candidate division KSB1 bacterium]|nr:nucleotidyltransferase domain-containing protein [candidate division KSB1 bacterium]
MQSLNQVVISEIVDRIVKAIHPHKVILFGSRARGTEHAHSDLDLLVVADSDKPRWERAAPIYGTLSDIMVQTDLLVYTPAEIEAWKDVRQAFITTAVREGKVLYERPA